MNIFITGASGFVGSRLIEVLSEVEWVDTIFALYRHKDQIPFLPKVAPVIGDLDDLAQMDQSQGVDIFIHLAGYFKNESKKLCESINLQGTKNSIEFCKNNGIDKFLFYSTINVDLKTKGCYATTKLACEQEVKNSGLEYMILRPSLIYDKEHGSIGTIMGSIKKLPFVPVLGSGKAKEQPIHITEIIELTIAMIKDFKPGKTLYAAGKDAMTFKEMIATIARMMNKKGRILPFPAKPVHAVLRLLERGNIHMGISSEQVAHMSEDLVADMHQTLMLYPIELKSFEENIQNRE